MRAAHRGAGQPAIHKWDIYNAIPPSGYKWDVFNTITTQVRRNSGTNEVFVIPFSAGHWCGGWYSVDTANGLFNFDKEATVYELLDGSSYTPSDYVGGSPGRYNLPMIIGVSYGKKDMAAQTWTITGIRHWFDAVKSKGTPRGETVNSMGTNDYPANGYHEATGLWYVFVSADLDYHKGSATGNMVTSYRPNTYPQNGYDAATDKWYMRR